MRRCNRLYISNAMSWMCIRTTRFLYLCSVCEPGPSEPRGDPLKPRHRCSTYDVIGASAGSQGSWPWAPFLVKLSMSEWRHAMAYSWILDFASCMVAWRDSCMCFTTRRFLEVQMVSLMQLRVSPSLVCVCAGIYSWLNPPMTIR